MEKPNAARVGLVFVKVTARADIRDVVEMKATATFAKGDMVKSGRLTATNIGNTWAETRCGRLIGLATHGWL